MTAEELWADPHHDSGPRFVSVARPHLGESVTVRVFVPGPQPSNLVVRQVIDAEISITEMRPAAKFGYWEAELTAANLVNRYRFALIGEPGTTGYRWLSAAGLFEHDISDSTDFVLSTHPGAPEWVSEAVVYQIFPDRFAPSGRHYELPAWAQPTPWGTTPSEKSTAEQYYGGDLWGVAQRLDYIEELGANTIYLTPVFPAGSVHRYDAASFDEVDPLLGGDDALIALVEAAHARGMRVILDITTNHTGMTHDWFQAAVSDPDAPEVGYYYFRNYPTDWLGWWNERTLPKLDHTNAGLRKRLYQGTTSVAAKWLQTPYLVDGWRVDVANMTGRLGAQDMAHDVASAMRATLADVASKTGRETWLVAEHGHDATRDLSGAGWHGTMNYQGFTRPIWAWLSDPNNDVDWLGLPMMVPHLSGRNVVRTLRSYNAEAPWPATCASQNQLDSHDTPRFRNVTRSDEGLLVGLAALVTMPGTPTVFAGDELGHMGTNGESSRTTPDWDAIDRGEPVTLAPFTQWLHLRRNEKALQTGGMRWVYAGTNAIAYVRTHPGGDVLVLLSRGPEKGAALPLKALEASGIEPILSFGEAKVESVGDQINLSSRGFGAVVVRLT